MPSKSNIPSNTLKPVSSNVPKDDPVLTPGKKVQTLQAELERKDAENKALLENIANLTSALNSLNLVKAKISNESSAVADDSKKKKKDKDAPLPAKTAYKLFCEAHPNKNDEDMRQVWKEVDTNTRALYTKMSLEDKARFQQQIKDYQEEKTALELYYKKKKEEVALEFMEAHLIAQDAVEKAEAEKKGKKKVPKDKEAPKRPTSSYMYFAIEKRDSVKKSHANATPIEISKVLGEMWNKLEKGKGGKKGTKKYDDLAAADKARYETEKAEYDALIAGRKAQTEQEKIEQLKQDKVEALKLFHSQQLVNSMPTVEEPKSVEDLSELTEEPKKGKKKKDPNAPKKPCSAYLFFCVENRPTIKSNMPESATNAELLTEIGKKWKELPEEDKAKYVQMAEKDKEKYMREMEKYNAGKV